MTTTNELPEVWSGDHRLADKKTARAQHLFRRRGVSCVYAIGTYREESICALADLVAAEAERPDVNVVIMYITSAAGELDGLQYARLRLMKARSAAVVVAQLNLAFGPGLFLGSLAQITFATPAARLGYCRCFYRTEQPLSFERQLSLARELAQRREKVGAHWWLHLADHWVNAEQAEALGIVDMLAKEPVDVMREFL